MDKGDDTNRSKRTMEIDRPHFIKKFKHENPKARLKRKEVKATMMKNLKSPTANPVFGKRS